MIPQWAQIVIGAAAVVTSLAVLWQKVVHPAVRLANNAEEMVPLLRELTVKFRDVPHAFDILKEIIAEFRTDSGSSLRDVVNRLEQASGKAAVDLETARVLAQRDRDEFQRMLGMLDRTIENQRIVAESLAVAKGIKEDGST